MTQPDTAGGTATLTVTLGEASFEAVAWEWLTLPTQRPDDVIAACAGAADTRGDHDSAVHIALDGTSIDDLSAPYRHQVGLGVAAGRLGVVPELRVLDIVLLGLRTPQPPLWQILLGGARARSRADDEEAEARALAGRTGLATWVSHPAAGLPPQVIALTDLTRALAGAPKAVVWRRPEWLTEEEQAEIAAVLVAEQDARGIPVIEVVTGPDASLPLP